MSEGFAADLTAETGDKGTGGKRQSQERERVIRQKWDYYSQGMVEIDR